MPHDHHHHHKDSDRIAFAFWLNLFFTIVEIIGGILTNSLSILSDALHDFGDSLSLGMAWFFQKFSRKGRDRQFTYGYRRFSLLGAIINSMVLVIGSVFIINAAIPRIINPQQSHAEGMILLAVVGILVNGAAVLRLRGGRSQNVRVVSLHLLEDVLGWVAVLIGGAVIYFTGWYRIDAVLSILIGLFILYNVFRNLRSTMNIILQGIPENVELQYVESTLRNTPGVLAFHDLHIWTLDGDKNLMTIHVVVSNGLDAEKIMEIKNNVKQQLSKARIDHCTVEIEFEDDVCIEDCMFVEDHDHKH